MSTSWRAVSAIFDSGTGVCAGFNSLYFALRMFSGRGQPSSRIVAQAILWLLSVATLVESVALLAIGSSGESGAMETAPWVVVRMLTLISTASLSALICRKLVAG